MTLDVIKELIGIRLNANEEKDKATEKVMRCPDWGILFFIAESPKRRGPPQLETTLWSSF